MTVLSTLLSPERYRPRLAKAAGNNLNVPVMAELRYGVGEVVDPVLVTNMRGSVVSTRKSSEGVVRYGFSEIPLEDEDTFITKMYQCIQEASVRLGWSNRCVTALDGIQKMRSLGLEPKYVVLPKGEFTEQEGKDAERLTLAQGHVTDLDGVQVLLASLPKGASIVTATPALVGVYTRVGEGLGMLLQRVDQTVMVGACDVV